MPKYGGDNQLSELNNQELVEMYHNLGTLDRVKAQIDLAGIINPHTKKPYSISSLRDRIVEYQIYNPEQTRKRFLERGEYYVQEDEQFYRRLVTMAMSIYMQRKRKFFEWITFMGFGNKYEWMYRYEYGLPPLPETQWMCQNCWTVNEIENQSCVNCKSPINYVPPRHLRRPQFQR